MLQLSDLRERLQACVRQAGALALSYYEKPVQVISKTHGFATEADHAVEQFLIHELQVLVPEAATYAEESGQTGDSMHGYCWVIDPIDGTTNFARGIPYFCISVALTLDGHPVVGVIYQPVLKELFYAESGYGAWLNGMRIAKRSPRLGRKVVVVWPGKSVQHEATLRYFGAAALDCAYLAAGKLDELEFGRVAWWDIAAGILLLKEAGVAVSVTQRTYKGQTVYRVVAGGS
ncbi:MAG: inositol monophosphatase [Epsilonproteobacteria bacterium]|nr:inositol monophosphatase [Campylobacterota bacterium]